MDLEQWMYAWKQGRTFAASLAVFKNKTADFLDYFLAALKTICQWYIFEKHI